jgi:hypothetical protein
MKSYEQAPRRCRLLGAVRRVRKRSVPTSDSKVHEFARSLSQTSHVE